MGMKLIQEIRKGGTREKGKRRERRRGKGRERRRTRRPNKGIDLGG